MALMNRIWICSILCLLAEKPCIAGFVQYATFDSGTVVSDLMPSNQVFNVGRPAITNSQMGFESFLVALGANPVIGIERFEHFAGVNPTGNPATDPVILNLDFERYLYDTLGTSVVTNEILGIDAILMGPNGQIARITNTNVNSAGRYPVQLPDLGILGDQYFDTNFAELAFIIDFGNTPVDAFGFFGTDLGDFNGQVRLTITDINNVVTMIELPHERESNQTITDRLNASLMFFGLTSDTAIRSIRFDNTNTEEGDRFGFDNFVVALADSTTVPEPSSVTMLLLGMVAVSLRFRRRKLAL